MGLRDDTGGTCNMYLNAALILVFFPKVSPENSVFQNHFISLFLFHPRA